MKKITLSLFAVACAVSSVFGQVTTTLTAPQYDGSSSSASGPNGTTGHTFHRAAFLIHQSELTGFLLTNSVVSHVGFNFLNGTGTPAAGNFTVYLENTTDAAYSKGGNFATIISTMFLHYQGSFVLPVTPNFTAVNLPLNSTFNYNGGGLYVAIEWEHVGPFTTTPAWYLCNTTGPGSLNTVGGVRNYGLTAPATLTNTAFRPAFNFLAGNNATNELQVLELRAPGKVSKLVNAPHPVYAWVRNNSNTTLNSVPVTLTALGFNNFNNTQVIPSIAAGATSLVTFAYNPTNSGLSTMSVTIPNDQVNTNNLAVWGQSVNCTDWANNPPIAPSSYTDGAWGFNTTGIISSRYITYSTGMSLNGIRLAVGNATVNPGKNIYGVLLNATGAIIATTNTITITAQMMDNYVVMDFQNPQNLTNNTVYHFGIAVPAGPTYPIGSLTVPQALNHYFTHGLAGGAPNPIDVGFMGIEGVLSFTNLNVSAASAPGTVCKGQTTTLTATGPANATYTWSGAGTGNGGVITATPTLPGSQPSVTVTYFLNGTDVASSCALNSTSVQVVVNQLPLINIGSRTLCVGQQTVVNPSGANSYTISGGSFSLKPAQTTTYAVTGTSTLTGCVSAPAMFTISIDPCTSINEVLTNGDVRMFPNPSIAGISQIIGLHGKTTVTVFNTLGQAVETINSNNDSVEIDLSGMANGHYLIRVENAGAVKTMKLVNQK